jgi:hypothetical protein
LPDDPLSALDSRIASLRAVRAAVQRFSDAFWEADDALTWLRAARDEVLRTGRLREDVASFLAASPAALHVEADAGEHQALPSLAVVATTTPVEADEPIVAA